MSEQADTRALRALVHEYNIKRFVTRGPEVNCAHEIMAEIADAAPALLDEVDAMRAESEHFKERIDKLSRRVAYYESALCASPPRLLALPFDAALTGYIEPERVGAVLAERDALRASVAELEREVERVREAAQALAAAYGAHTSKRGAAWFSTLPQEGHGDVWAKLLAALAPRAEGSATDAR